MKETKSVNVDPEMKDYILDINQSFGWTCISIETIDYSTSSIEGSYGVYTNYIERTKYYNLVFQRDTSINNYESIKKLEMEYGLLDAKREELMNYVFKPNYGWLWIGYIVCCIPVTIGIIYANKYEDYEEYESKADTAFTIGAVISGIMLVCLIIFMFYYIYKNNKQNQIFENQKNIKIKELTCKMESILNESKGMVE